MKGGCPWRVDVHGGWGVHSGWVSMEGGNGIVLLTGAVHAGN